MKKHRKLFPTSYTNQTLNCDDCYPYCPYDCYQEQIYFPPPPPIRSGHHTTNQFPPYLIAIVAISFGVFLLLGLYALLVKCSSCFRGAGRVLQSEAPGEEFLDENHGSELDHPIWYIRMVGLQPSTINSITVIKFKKGDHQPSLIEGTDCSVCLNEFQDDETLRLLPKCNHAFHIPCIDTWLRSHTNCPMCRAGILSNDNQSSRSLELGANQNTQMVNQENGAADVDANQVREGEIGEHGEETGAGTEDPKIE